jgi:hypothetical protein
VTAVFDRWSSFKLGVLPHTLLFIVTFYGIVLLVLIYEYSRTSNAKTRFLIEFFGFVVLSGMIQFVLPVIGDGEADLSKHLFFFNFCFDLLFTTAVTYITVKAAVLIKWTIEKRLSARLQSD